MLIEIVSVSSTCPQATCQMVNKLMESIYTRMYMSQHSLSGSSPRLSRAQKEINVRLNTPPPAVKPGLPKEDVVAITHKYIAFSFIFLEYEE